MTFVRIDSRINNLKKYETPVSYSGTFEEFSRGVQTRVQDRREQMWNLGLKLCQQDGECSFNPLLSSQRSLCMLSLHSEMVDWFIATDGQFKITKLSISLFPADEEGGHFLIIWYTFKVFQFPMVLFVTNLLPYNINTAGFMLWEECIV